MTALITGVWMVAALAQGPPTGEMCKIEYEEVVGSATAIRSTVIAPSTTKSINDVVLRIVNRESRPLEARLLPPAGPLSTVTLQSFGATDPPALQYLGNWTLESVHCPSAYPSAQHMWDAEGTLEDVRREFQLSIEAAAVLLRNDFQNVEMLGAMHGALPTLMEAYPEHSWSASSAAELLRGAQYPAAAAVHGLLRSTLVPGGTLHSRMGTAMATVHAAGYSVAEALEGSRATVRSMVDWDKSTHETWLDSMPVQARFLFEAGFSYADVAGALVDVFAPTADEFIGSYYFKAWKVRGADASGRTAKALEAQFSLDGVGIARTMLGRSPTTVYQGEYVDLAGLPEHWQGARDELRDGLYATPMQRCIWLGQATIQTWQDRPPPLGGTTESLQSIRQEWNQVPDDDIEQVRQDFASDLAQTAECLLGATFSPARILTFADARIPAAEQPVLAAGFRAHGVECGPLIDALTASGRDTEVTYKWIRAASYPDVGACLDFLSDRTGQFLVDYYVAELGVSEASLRALRRGWSFVQTADAIDWFRPPTPRFGDIVRAYRAGPEESLEYLRTFARAQNRELVFDYPRYLLEAFPSDVACKVIAGANWGRDRAPQCARPRGNQ